MHTSPVPVLQVEEPTKSTFQTKIQIKNPTYPHKPKLNQPEIFFCKPLSKITHKSQLIQRSEQSLYCNHIIQRSTKTSCIRLHTLLYLALKSEEEKEQETRDRLDEQSREPMDAGRAMHPPVFIHEIAQGGVGHVSPWFAASAARTS